MTCDKNCAECVYSDCIRDELQDRRDSDRANYKANSEPIRIYQYNRYHGNIETARAYSKHRQRIYYSTEKNTEKCRLQREKDLGAKKKYDKDRYLRKKAERVS